MRAAVYCRMSLARDDDTTKVDAQEKICRELCERRGWEVRDVYSDNNRSAWQKNRSRPQWDRMLADVDAGKIDAIVVYHGDRLVRQPYDLEILLRLADGKGIQLASPTGTRDLDHAEDRTMLRVLTAFATGESDSTSRRKKDQYKRLRAQGIVRAGGRGGRAYGFKPDGGTHVPEETAVIREAAARVLAGEGAGSICADLTARGIVTVTGIPFAHGTLRKLLARPRYAGLMPDGEHEAAWEPVLERSQWEAVRAVLSDRAAGFGYATNARKYLLSGLAECGAEGCGSLLQIRQSKGRKGKAAIIGYGCTEPGCRKVYRSQPMLDHYVAQRVVLLLGREDNPVPQLPRAPGMAQQYAALDSQRREIEDVLADPSRGSVPALLVRLDRVNARLAELRELSAGDARARLRAAHAGMTMEEFLASPLAVRRSLVSASFRVEVLPASKKGPGFRVGDVRLSQRG